MKFISKKLAPTTSELGDGPATQASRLSSSDDTIFATDGRSILRVGIDTVFKEGETSLALDVCHEAESSVQSITCNGGTIAAVDALNNLVLSEDNGTTFKQISSATRSKSVESGWCGVAFNKADNSLASTNMWARETTVLGGNFRFEHELPPLSVCGSDSKPGVYYVTEWNDVTIWDVRAPRGGLVERLISNQVGGGGNGPLWAATALGNYFCVGGEDRTVSLFDDRRMRIMDTWKTPLKHDIVAVELLDAKGSVMNKSCIAAGLDHELCHWPIVAQTSKRTHVSGDQARIECIERTVETEEEERRTDFGRLHHNHRVFRAKCRWTGMCNVRRGGVNTSVIGRDTEGTLYAFDMQE